MLLTIHFFRTDSIRAQFNNNALEIRNNPFKLIWYDPSAEPFEYAANEIKIITSRWFILLQLGKGKSRINRLLLADSFVDNNHYTSFRRLLNEMYLC
jgi:hypothetical protein